MNMLAGRAGRRPDAHRLRRADGPRAGLGAAADVAGRCLCRHALPAHADAQIVPLRDQANANTVGSTLLGAGLGAALGGAIGGGRGAGIGAASGAVVGAGAGASNAQYAAMDPGAAI